MSTTRLVFRNKKAIGLRSGSYTADSLARVGTEHFGRCPDGYIEVHGHDSMGEAKIRFAFTLSQYLTLISGRCLTGFKPGFKEAADGCVG